MPDRWIILRGWGAESLEAISAFAQKRVIGTIFRSILVSGERTLTVKQHTSFSLFLDAMTMCVATLLITTGASPLLWGQQSASGQISPLPAPRPGYSFPA